MTRRVLVTGGTTGIGKAIAIAFKEKGYKVAVNYLFGDEEAKKFEMEFGIKVVKWDVTDFSACKDGTAMTAQALGGNVEILVNNAGITKDGMLHKQTYENWIAVINTNLTSVFNMSRAVIEEMRNAKFGRIINLSSVNANGMAGQTNYTATKAGIEGFTKSLALEGAKLNVTVNAIAPGYTNTEMVAKVPQDAMAKILEKVPMQRLAEVREIAAAALFLGSEDAGFVTGAVIPVNGGLHM
ncbi:Acetoacetyl-CoA reductase [Alphaproteobacteria bacterium]